VTALKDLATRAIRAAKQAVFGTVRCKIWGGDAVEKFRLPHAKRTGHPIPDLPDDCPYYECSRCLFLFANLLDAADHTEIYNDAYWNHQDPVLQGRVTEGLRMVMLANQLLQMPPYEIEILDFGCGMGAFIETCRTQLGLKAWGTDIVTPKFGTDYFLRPVERQFDLVFCVEVLEHLPNPVETLTYIKSLVRPGGAFAFQTAQWDPPALGRDWWYLGPANGHISLYSREALDHLFARLGGTRRVMWNDYAGTQAWAF
jgi:SAM-dependent methyltransferase